MPYKTKVYPSPLSSKYMRSEDTALVLKATPPFYCHSRHVYKNYNLAANACNKNDLICFPSRMFLASLTWDTVVFRSFRVHRVSDSTGLYATEH